MTDVFIGIAGHRVRAIVLHVANRGPWVADVTMVDDVELAGAVELVFGPTTLRGTVVPQQAGMFALQTSVRIVGGGAGWGSQLPPKAYHSDAGVKAKVVAEDAAREAGETLGSFVVTPERLGLDYVRAHGTAAVTLEHASGGAPWWVDYDGNTNVGPRPTSQLPSKSYDLLTHNPQTRVAELALDDISALRVGSVISDERLGASLVVRDFEVSTKDNSKLRATVWCGGLDTEPGRLPGIMRAIVERIAEGSLPGVYRYRVATMLGDGRCELQAVRAAAGLPDIKPVSQWPGVPGVAARCALGAEVLVQFIDADPTQPILTHYAGEQGAGFVPTSLSIEALTSLVLDAVSVKLGGASATQGVARLGDSVLVTLPYTPQPAPGPSVPFPVTGTITGGSTKVKAA